MELLTELYDHQIRSVEKLRHIKVGALYMEMGTGKTRAALELINIRLNADKVDHVLWLCPCSVKTNLKYDIIKHVGELPNNFTICGIETLSSSVRANSELLALVRSKRCYLIVDESNLVKNHMAQRTKNIIRLAGYCTYKLILNGTPITRTYQDLYAQWYILDYRILGYKSFWSFSANHLEYDERYPNKLRRCLNVDYLTEKIAPYSYQITKSECLSLPDKTYETAHYDLTDSQYEHYINIADELMMEVDDFEPHTIYRLFTALQNIIGGKRVYNEKKLRSVSFFSNPIDNPRIQLMMEIADRTYDKMIIYCKYTDEIKAITMLLNDKYGQDIAVPFYGELNQKKRQANLEKFMGDSQYLVANKVCAGYGLNLQFCSYVVYYSNDWDYGTRAQSEDRVHRIGQEKNVHIIDICADDTLDKRILDCLIRKEDLVDRFKCELDLIKDNKESLINWLTCKTYDGRKYKKRVKLEKCEDLRDAEVV